MAQKYDLSNPDMTVYRLAVETLNNGHSPKDYREMADLWVRMNPDENIKAFQDCVRAARISTSEVGFYKPKTRKDAINAPHRLGMKIPASLMRMLEMADPEVLTNDKKYNKLKQQLPMLCPELKYVY